jgi:hypothetical protein
MDIESKIAEKSKAWWLGYKNWGRLPVICSGDKDCPTEIAEFDMSDEGMANAEFVMACIKNATLIAADRAGLVEALRRAAEQAYQDEIIDTEMKHISIGKGKEWETKAAWIKDRIAEWEVQNG